MIYEKQRQVREKSCRQIIEYRRDPVLDAQSPIKMVVFGSLRIRGSPYVKI